MQHRNSIAKNLLDKLVANGIEALPGYFGGSTYCVGVRVSSPSEAVKLGMLLGESHGDVGWDRFGDGFIIAFRDAHVGA